MDWWKNQGVYQIYPRSFLDTTGNGMGDLQGIIKKLDYLKTLGVGAVWLCPVFESPQADNGYDISDYLKIDPIYGTNDDMYALINEAHKREIKVILDLVVNHTSDKHPWFLASRDKNSPYRDYYYWRPGKRGKEPNNWGSAFSESAWTYDEKSGEYYFSTFSPRQPDLNWNNPSVIDEVVSILRFWQDRGVDGWRIDAINYIDKCTHFKDYDPKDFPKGQKYFMGDYHFKNGKLYDMISSVNSLAWSEGKSYMTVAELGGDFSTNDILKFTADGTAFTMCFTFGHLFCDINHSSPFHKWTVKKLDLKAFKRDFAKYQRLLKKGADVALFINNHDQPRFISRLTSNPGYYADAAKSSAMMLHMLGGTPFIYQGEELGMSNCRFDADEYKDIEFWGAYDEFVGSGRVSEKQFLAAAAYRARDNSRTPMQWNASRVGGFTLGIPWIKVNENHLTINASAQIDDENSVFSFYKKLLELRKNEEIIVKGEFGLVSPGDKYCFSYTRTFKNEVLFVSCNLSERTVNRKLPFRLIGEEGRIMLFAGEERKAPGYRYTLRPFEAFAAVYKINQKKFKPA